MNKQYYAAILTSPQALQANRTFQEQVKSSAGKPQAAPFIALVNLLLEEVLQAFFLEPARQFKLNRVAMKLVQTGVGVMKKTSQAAISKVLKKMSNRELQPLADYILTLVWEPLPERPENGILAFKVSDELYEQLQNVINAGRAGNPLDHRQELADVLVRFVDEGAQQLVINAVALIKLGFVTQKIVDVALDTGISAAHTLVSKLPGAMKERELLMFYDFLESLLIETQDGKIQSMIVVKGC